MERQFPLVADTGKIYKDISLFFRVNNKVSDSIRSQDKLYQKSYEKFVKKNIDINGLRSRYKTRQYRFSFFI